MDHVLSANEHERKLRQYKQKARDFLDRFSSSRVTVSAGDVEALAYLLMAEAGYR